MGNDSEDQKGAEGEAVEVAETPAETVINHVEHPVMLTVDPAEWEALKAKVFQLEAQHNEHLAGHPLGLDGSDHEILTGLASDLRAQEVEETGPQREHRRYRKLFN